MARQGDYEGELPYRKPTRDERALLDEAREKLSAAYLKGDEVTVQLAVDAIRKTLRAMRIET